MYNSPRWREWRVPVSWALLPSDIKIILIIEARDNREIELMIDFDGDIWWRRDLCEDRELGL